MFYLAERSGSVAGRLQRLQPMKNQNAGPVNCIRLFGALFSMSCFACGLPGQCGTMNITLR
jgi:hypothetical protein